MISRRQFLISGAVFGCAGVYSYRRGLRYPRLSFAPQPLASTLEAPYATFSFKDAIIVTAKSSGIKFRAIAPEPQIIMAAQRGKHKIELTNIASNATLTISGTGIKLIDEEINGTNRTLHIDTATEQELNFKWALFQDDGFDFAVIGDTGGGHELAWSLEKAHELNAQFLLHLGDFNYGGDEYAQAIDQFNNAPLPCYVSIGNHDFHDNGLIYQRFLNELGPMNHAFELAGTRFVNIDTAADFFPAHSGRRGDLIKHLQSADFDGEQIFFTHRPLKDPRPHDDHEIGGINEIEWLSQSMQALGANTLLNGHVHHSAELEYEGIKQFTIGEGLGHEDLVLQKHVAKLMLTRVQRGSAMRSKWIDLNMPWSLHQSHTHEYKLRRDGRQKQLDWYLKEVKRQDLS